jgi:spore germination protein YaaH
MQDQFEDSQSSRLRGCLGGLAIYVLILGLLVAIILLPPISAVDRVLSYGYADIPEEGGFVTAEDGAQLLILPEGLQGRTKVKFTTIPRSSFLQGAAGNDLLTAAESIPLWLIMKSPYYQIQFRGQEPTKVMVRIPMPIDSEPLRTLDLYSWNGAAWEWLPHFLPPGDDFIEAELDYLPRSVVVVQTKPLQPSISASLPQATDLPQQARDTLEEINPQGLYLDALGAIRGDPGALLQPDQAAGYQVVPTLRNWEEEDALRSDLVDNMLADSSTRQEHVQRIVELVVGNAYPGVDIDYRGISPDLHGEYTDFITQLADALHEQGKQLSVRVEAPQQIAADQWDTGAYNLRAIGAVADRVRLPLPSDSGAYVPGGQTDTLLQYAVGEVDRYKVRPLISTRSTGWIDGTLRAVPYAEALAPFSQVAVEGGSTSLAPEREVAFTLAGPEPSSGIQFDPNSGIYWVAYAGSEGQQNTVWVENAASMARKLGYVVDYNLEGVAVHNLLGEENDSQIWGVLDKFVNLVIPPVEGQLAVAWQVRSASGEVLAQESAELANPRYVWTAPAEAGDYSVTAAISSDGGATAAGRGSVSVLVATP